MRTIKTLLWVVGILFGYFGYQQWHHWVGSQTLVFIFFGGLIAWWLSKLFLKVTNPQDVLPAAGRAKWNAMTRESKKAVVELLRKDLPHWRVYVGIILNLFGVAVVALCLGILCKELVR